MNCHTAEEFEARKRAGGIINLCPFGCQDDDLDEHGYCQHLVGFTPSETPKIGDKIECAGQVLTKTLRNGDETPDDQIKYVSGKVIDKIMVNDKIVQFQKTQRGDGGRTETVSLLKSPRIYRDKVKTTAIKPKAATEAAAT